MKQPSIPTLREKVQWEKKNESFAPIQGMLKRCDLNEEKC